MFPQGKPTQSSSSASRSHRSAKHPNSAARADELLGRSSVSRITLVPKLLEDLGWKRFQQTNAVGCSPALANTNDESQVIDMQTIHMSKGSEWKVVFVAGCDESSFPVSTSDGVEADSDVLVLQRLLFVAVTRASRRVFLTFHRSARSGNASEWAIFREATPLLNEACKRVASGAALRRLVVTSNGTNSKFDIFAVDGHGKLPLRSR